MKITKEQIHDVAQELDFGMNVFINPKTMVIKSIPHFELGFEDELLEKEKQEIDEWESFICIEKPDSSESFVIMEDFIEQVEDETVRQILTQALRRRKPFANFKDALIETDYIDDWYTFKLQMLEDYVKKCVQENELEYEE